MATETIYNIVFHIWKTFSNVVCILQQLPFIFGASHAATSSTRALIENAVDEQPKVYLFQFLTMQLFPAFHYLKQRYKEHSYTCG